MSNWLFSNFPFRGGGGGPDGGDHDPKLPRFYQNHSLKGSFMQKDRSGNPHGGGMQFKGFDSKGTRVGTFNENGDLLRK